MPSAICHASPSPRLSSPKPPLSSHTHPDFLHRNAPLTPRIRTSDPLRSPPTLHQPKHNRPS
ncbi:hypothetical protein PMIN01_01449 [Paraphaeosphaeria minitans]|uniref:Uncharacterized protein n=1 Tax=Paraphaeosphaeria minitans TaxID=565426 RepID=A0A9P6KWY8_9PLEO|nr:hypothetical protein PMIN01_01449 [Paraphaeosphaeria minitans]